MDTPDLDRDDYSADEVKQLLDARQALLDIMWRDGIGNGLDKADKILLTRIRWALDRMEVRRHPYLFSF